MAGYLIALGAVSLGTLTALALIRGGKYPEEDGKKMDDFTLGMVVAAAIASEQCTVTAMEILGAAGIKHGDQLAGADAHDIERFISTGMAMDGLKVALGRARQAEGGE